MNTLLSETDGLAEAITEVISQHGWVNAVEAAHPDLASLLETDEAFKKAAEARRTKLGPKWHDPTVAVGALEQLKAERVRDMSEAEFLKVRNKVLGL